MKIEPSTTTVQVVEGQEVIVQAIYLPVPPSLGFSYSNGLRLNGAKDAWYRINYATKLTARLAWTNLTTLKLSGPSVTIPNTRPATTGNRFYRAELVP